MRFSEHLKKASLVGAFFVFVLFSLQAQALCSATGPLSRADVATVIDGDTLRLRDGRSVRLIGLNAPELGRKGRKAEPYAQAAKRRLQVLVDASDGRIGLRPGQQGRDHYGRVLAHAFDHRGANLEAALLVEGLGYFVAMMGVDEVHLLNITVAPAYQKQGWARVLLDALALWARGRGAQWLWLEVRVSNERALHVYQAHGFRRVGERKRYYPAPAGQREDAVVMSLPL